MNWPHMSISYLYDALILFNVASQRLLARIHILVLCRLALVQNELEIDCAAKFELMHSHKRTAKTRNIQLKQQQKKHFSLFSVVYFGDAAVFGYFLQTEQAPCLEPGHFDRNLNEVVVGVLDNDFKSNKYLFC